MANIELPKDAEGREIPLDTDALYDKNGERLTIYAWEYISKIKHSKWRVLFLFDVSGFKYYPDDYYLTPPDSWEKLEDDLDRCIKWSNSCRYFSPEWDCRKCARPESDTRGCTASVFKSIKDRIRKLRDDD